MTIISVRYRFYAIIIVGILTLVSRINFILSYKFVLNLSDRFSYDRAMLISYMELKALSTHFGHASGKLLFLE